MDKPNRHILFVDDFKDTREMYAHFLSSKGYRVTECGDGHEAVEKAAQLQPDLIVMDLSLPRMNGWAASRRLKADPKTEHIPIIILTAYDMTADLVEILPKGCAAVMMKPCLPNDMRAAIHQALAGVPQSERPETPSSPEKEKSAKAPSSSRKNS